jgi:hypothetical protein
MIARTEVFDPMASFTERPQMHPRFTVHGDTCRMAYVGENGKQVCLVFDRQTDLASHILKAIAAQDQWQQASIDELNRQIQVP